MSREQYASALRTVPVFYAHGCIKENVGRRCFCRALYLEGPARIPGRVKA